MLSGKVEGGSPKDDLLHRRYLIKKTTRGGGRGSKIAIFRRHSLLTAPCSITAKRVKGLLSETQQEWSNGFWICIKYHTHAFVILWVTFVTWHSEPKASFPSNEIATLTKLAFPISHHFQRLSELVAKGNLFASFKCDFRKYLAPLWNSTI